MNTFEQILGSMVSGGDYSNALKSISRIQEVVSKKSEAVDANDEGIGEYDGGSIINYDDVANLMNLAQTMGDIIHQYEKYLDRKLVPDILAHIEGNVQSEASAVQAIYHYNADWFKSTPISSNSKSLVADKLLTVCNRYYQYNMPLWQSLSGKNATTYTALLYKYSGD